LSTNPHSKTTIAYYDRNASEFCERTLAVDMSEFYEPFLGEVPAGGTILDAGCGSGRDSRAFLQKGYEVVSIDASPAMVDATTRLTGRRAKLLNFDAIDFREEFDGIWACASLLHVVRENLGSVLDRLAAALKPGGVLYLSFKYGEAERVEDGRYFNDVNESLFESTLAQHSQLEIRKIWTTEENSIGRRQRWINGIARRRLND
jgi:SAM-dependent methyltransferase